MAVTDLADWLLAQYAADEALACEQNLDRAGQPYSDGSGIADRDGFPSYPWGAEEQELRFMAGPGHPVSVLADLAAKRRIVELHRTEEACPYHSRTSEYLFGCRTCHFDSECGYVMALGWCDTVRLLALALAGREGYDPAWAPE